MSCSRLLCTSDSMPSMMSTPRSRFVSATASAASNVQPPMNTEMRRKSRCSASPSRSWLQAIAPRSVCWRAGRSRAPPVRIWSRVSIRPRSADGGSVFTRAAASSIASGRPSSRLQISPIARAFSLVSAKAGFAVCARSTNSITAGLAASDSSDVVRCASGRDSGATGTSCSLDRRSGSRLVTTILSGAAIFSRSTTNGTAPSRCSKLSSSSSVGLPLCITCSAIASSGATVPRSGRRRPVPPPAGRGSGRRSSPGSRSARRR